jgi:pimeloyl-ACP methyl ester carboxylesterase/tellurite resistance protein
MHTSKTEKTDFGAESIFLAQEYLIDRFQRSILFWDILRKRGNTYLSHVAAGQPPILIFDFEMVLDGRSFPRPVNYALVRILDRRQSGASTEFPGDGERRVTSRNGKAVERNGLPARPIVIIDPRAGHGPGIGGSKKDSEIGVALDFGHPVYFVLFYTDPEPGQTIADVERAEVQFLEKVVKLHPEAPKPAVIGNCQAGWAAALIGADRPDLTGPLILNGSPLSYWGGVEGRNPMRYRGGLYGGVWLATLASDVGCGKFDGAHLVAGFEELNPANAFWSKYYHLFANVDTEEQRFLGFEKWWGGFYRMNEQEIHFIVDSLFIGDELEQGTLRLDDGRLIDLKNFREPIFAFASKGDNITPPPQALNWIYKVYGTVAEIRRRNQVIIYMIHEKIGHLGIFVSGSVARKEHKQILSNLGWLEYLQPGLYEMIITEDSDQPGVLGTNVQFAEREMEDILKLDDGLADERPFVPVREVSRLNDEIYQSFLQPWVRMIATEGSAEMIRQLHPLRMQHYMISDANPWTLPVKWLARQVEAGRRPAAEDNPFAVMEEFLSDTVEVGLNYYRDMRDLAQEYVFKSIYGNPLTNLFFGAEKRRTAAGKQNEDDNRRQRQQELAGLEKAAEKGGFVEACVRVMIAVADIDRVMDVREFQLAEKIIQENPRLKALSAEEYKTLVREQARILAMVPQKAISGLGRMGLSEKNRRQLYRIAEMIARSDGERKEKEGEILTSLKRTLQLEASGLKN